MSDTYSMGNICIFGASITWGGNDRDVGGWVNRLRLWIDEKTEYERITMTIGHAHSLFSAVERGIVRYPWYIALYKGFVVAGMSLLSLFISFFL